MKYNYLMKATYYLLIAFLLFFSSCSEEEQSSCQVKIQLLPPEGYPTLPFEEMTVILTNQSQGGTYKSICSSTGLVDFHVECGYYTVSVHYQATSGLIFSGRIESLALLPEQGNTSESVELQLFRSKTNAIVIKEIYYGGCIGKMGEEYQADQYVTLYNNSSETVYLDKLCMAVVDPANSMESPWMKYADMSRIPINDLTWQFPGTGNDYPLAPGAETTIATNAVNHAGGEYQHTNSVDLSKADWGFWDVSLSGQDIHPGVTPLRLISKLNPNISKYFFPIWEPTFMIFSLQGISTEDYVSDLNNREPRPQATNQSKLYLMVPQEWVIDCVECVRSADMITLKRVPNNLNHTPAYISEGAYCGKSLVRKKSLGTNKQVIYQDTNNAFDDFEVSVPLLKK